MLYWSALGNPLFVHLPLQTSAAEQHPGTVVLVFLVINDTYSLLNSISFFKNNSITVNIQNSAFIRLGEKRNKRLCRHRTKHMNKFYFLAATCVTCHIGAQHFFSFDPVMGLNKLLFWKRLCWITCEENAELSATHLIKLKQIIDLMFRWEKFMKCFRLLSDKVVWAGAQGTTGDWHHIWILAGAQCFLEKLSKYPAGTYSLLKT